MRKFVLLTLALALLSTPLFAAKWFASKGTTVDIPENVAVGSTQIAAGEYKVTYQGSGPAVKVTLARSGLPPIVLDATSVATGSGNPSVTTASANGVRVLLKIDLGRTTLVFENSQLAAQ